MTQPNAQKEAARVTLVGMWLDLLLGFAKIVGGLLSGSFALVTDGVHSLTDAASDIFVLIVSYFAHEAPDEEHPYGHGRFEAIGTVMMGMLFFAIAAVLLYESYLRLNSEEAIAVPGWGALLIAGISIATKEWIYHYTMRTANRLSSSLLRANAWHSRSDAISSIAVLVGILGARQGFPWLDVVAAMFVAVIIARIGWQLCLDSLRELVDTAIPAEHQARVRHSILSVPGIKRLTSLRSRQSGGKIILEIQVQVDPRISVSEGHQLGEAVTRTIMDKFRNINDVVVHIDPESHSEKGASELPMREEIVTRIIDCWGTLLERTDIKHIDLHYLDNSVEVDLYLVAGNIDTNYAERLADALRPIHAISKLKVYSNILEASVVSKLS